MTESDALVARLTTHYSDKVRGKTSDYGPFTNADWQNVNELLSALTALAAERDEARRLAEAWRNTSVAQMNLPPKLKEARIAHADRLPWESRP